MDKKLSCYNSKILIGGHTVIYNALSGKCVVIKNHSVLTWKDLEYLYASDNVLAKNLTDGGIYINKNINEVSILESRVMEGMNNSDEYILHINPTLDCNFKCWYCYENHVPKSKMSEDIILDTIHLVENILNQPQIKRINLSFFGGEPLLYFDEIAKTIISYSNELCLQLDKSLYINFTSNGYLLTEEIINWLAQFTCGFQITLDGGKEHHNNTRFSKGGIGSYEEIVGNIRKLSAAGIKVILRVNYTSRNIESVRSIYDSLSDLPNAKKNNINVDFQRVWQDKESINDVTEKKISEIRNFFSDNGFYVLTNYLPSDVRMPCYGDKVNHALINYSGEVFGCTARDFTSPNRIGVLDKSGKILYNERFKFWRGAKMAKKICKTCRIAPLCGGGCIQKSYENANMEGCSLGYSEEDMDKLIIDLIYYSLSRN